MSFRGWVRHVGVQDSSGEGVSNRTPRRRTPLRLARMSQKAPAFQGSKREVTEHLPAIRTNFYSNRTAAYLAAEVLVKWDDLSTNAVTART